MTVQSPYGPFPMYVRYPSLIGTPHVYGNDQCGGPGFGPFEISGNKFSADGSCETGKFFCGRLFSAKITKL